MAKLRSQLKESQEAVHSRQRLEQQLDNRRSITSPVLSSNRKLIGGSSSPDDSTAMKMELQRFQRRLADMQQSMEAERQVRKKNNKSSSLIYVFQSEECK